MFHERGERKCSSVVVLFTPPPHVKHTEVRNPDLTKTILTGPFPLWSVQNVKKKMNEQQNEYLLYCTTIDERAPWFISPY